MRVYYNIGFKLEKKIPELEKPDGASPYDERIKLLQDCRTIDDNLKAVIKKHFKTTLHTKNWEAWKQTEDANEAFKSRVHEDYEIKFIPLIRVTVSMSKSFLCVSRCFGRNNCLETRLTRNLNLYPTLARWDNPGQPVNQVDTKS